jgi:hypothetical protein
MQSGLRKNMRAPAPFLGLLLFCFLGKIGLKCELHCYTVINFDGQWGMSSFIILNYVGTYYVFISRCQM